MEFYPNLKIGSLQCIVASFSKCQIIAKYRFFKRGVDFLFDKPFDEVLPKSQHLKIVASFSKFQLIAKFRIKTEIQEVVYFVWGEL